MAIPATPHKRGSMMLKVYTMYVHQEFSTIEIGRKLRIDPTTVSDYLKKVEQMSPELRKHIRRQRKKNERDRAYKSHLVKTPEWVEA
ncbi:hypothetical protein SD70_02370 [Gordoniibacillus kamchatkensis]|uniref:Transposase n=1 Tax=Gordoniibacillus kamchatkensis TaxID=1590651 RepID=A0ABR5AM60_9BACL|nr:hypothetical protein [Paenibacillus sp. VKM B-2647]KIL42051.1 hypothetical protein SD70_02370 [Paenibacillus sp. VKM B-2647]